MNEYHLSHGKPCAPFEHYPHAYPVIALHDLGRVRMVSCPGYKQTEEAMKIK